jgi:hypothetical protein
MKSFIQYLIEDNINQASNPSSISKSNLITKVPEIDDFINDANAIAKIVIPQIKKASSDVLKLSDSEIKKQEESVSGEKDPVFSDIRVKLLRQMQQNFTNMVNNYEHILFKALNEFGKYIEYITYYDLYFIENYTNYLNNMNWQKYQYDPKSIPFKKVVKKEFARRKLQENVISHFLEYIFREPEETYKLCFRDLSNDLKILGAWIDEHMRQTYVTGNKFSDMVNLGDTIQSFDVWAYEHNYFKLVNDEKVYPEAGNIIISTARECQKRIEEMLSDPKTGNIPTKIYNFK